MDTYAGDVAEVDFRLGTFRAGIGPSFLATVYGIAYALWTWNEPHRSALVLLFVLVTVSAVLVLLLPLEAVVRSRWREPFFLGWSAGIIALGISAPAFDGGASSPLAVLLFLPLVFAALSYPLGSMLAVSGVTICAYLAMALIGGHIAASHAFLFACALLTAAWICTWQSMNHSAVRRDLARVSRTDALTGVLNRRGFEERFDGALDTARRTGAPIALVLVDLDGFKAVNDESGHAAGDELLCWVAGRLRTTVRGGDDVGRLGGDEFAVLLSTGADDAAAARARIDVALAERAPASVGVAVFPHDGDSAEALHRSADTALYARKREGRRRDTVLRRAA